MAILILAVITGVAMLVMGLIGRRDKKDEGMNNIGTFFLVFGIVIMLVMVGIGISKFSNMIVTESTQNTYEYMQGLSDSLTKATGMQWATNGTAYLYVDAGDYKYMVTPTWDKVARAHFMDINIYESSRQWEGYPSVSSGDRLVILLSADNIDEAAVKIKKFYVR